MCIVTIVTGIGRSCALLRRKSRDILLLNNYNRWSLIPSKRSTSSLVVSMRYSLGVMSFGIGCPFQSISFVIGLLFRRDSKPR